MRGTLAVSYTHLDVYKRQAVNAVLLHYAGYIRYFSKVNGQVNDEVEDYVKPVSYTHLDVYKRQL